MAIAAEIAEKSITELAERGVKAAVMFTAGFAEGHEAGEAAQHRMVAEARKHNMRILGCNVGASTWRTGVRHVLLVVRQRCQAASASPRSPALTAPISTLARTIGASLCIMTVVPMLRSANASAGWRRTPRWM